MQQLQVILVIAFGGALGALARYATVVGATSLWGERFPYGTLLVNVLGSLVMGIAAAGLPQPHEKTLMGLWLRYGLMVGFLGAYTTFSAFSLDTLRQLEEGNALFAIANIVGNVTLCLLALWTGLRLGQWIF